MADDIFLSPEEQDERAKQWLKENGPAILIGIVLGLGAIYGYNHYQAEKIIQAQSASAAFEEIVEISAGSELADIERLADEVKENYAGTSYAAKAALLKARRVLNTDVAAAKAELQWVLDNSDEPAIWHTANIRLAKIMLSEQDYAGVIALVETELDQGFDSHYHELLADAHRGMGASAQAAEHYQAAITALAPGEVGYERILTMKL